MKSTSPRRRRQLSGRRIRRLPRRIRPKLWPGRLGSVLGPRTIHFVPCKSTDKVAKSAVSVCSFCPFLSFFWGGVRIKSSSHGYFDLLRLSRGLCVGNPSQEEEEPIIWYLEREGGGPSLRLNQETDDSPDAKSVQGGRGDTFYVL